jgi:hypothetical protein
MAGISVRTFRNLLRNKALRTFGFIIAGLVALSMVIFFAYVPPMGLKPVSPSGNPAGEPRCCAWATIASRKRNWSST